jgi:hypothetical protein
MRLTPVFFLQGLFTLVSDQVKHSTVAGGLVENTAKISGNVNAPKSLRTNSTKN